MSEVAGLGGMCESVKDEVGDVLISQPIFDVFATATAGDQSFGAQDAEPLGNGGEFFAFGNGNFGDAGGTAGK